MNIYAFDLIFRWNETELFFTITFFFFIIGRLKNTRIEMPTLFEKNRRTFIAYFEARAREKVQFFFFFIIYLPKNEVDCRSDQLILCNIFAQVQE